MRKLILIAAVIVFAALVLFLARGLGRAPGPVLHPDEAAPAEEPRPSLPLDPTTPSDEARAPLAHDSGARSPSSVLTGSGSLRVHVSFAPAAADRAPEGLQVRVSDLLGVQRDAHRESPLEFLVTGLAAGEYVIAASESASIDAVVHAKVEAPAQETSLDLVLEPATRVRVRWRSSDGRPIALALADHDEGEGSVKLAVSASHQPVPDGPVGSKSSLAAIEMQFDRVHVPGEERAVLRPARFPLVDGNTGWPPADDVFGELGVPSRAPFWVCAWWRSSLVESREVQVGQEEVVFTIAPIDMRMELAHVSFCVVDDESEEPVDPILVTANGRFATRFDLRPDTAAIRSPPGCGVLAIEPGWSTLVFGRSNSADEGREELYAGITLRVNTEVGEDVDLGVLRMSRARKVRYTVSDEKGKRVEGAEFELIKLSSYDGSAAPLDSRRVWSDREGVLTLGALARERYVVTCSSPRIDAPPFVVDAARIAVGDERVAGDIVVSPVRQISLVFDDPPHAGSLMMIETPDGLPVRTIEMDEFGIVPLWLSGTEYRVHLVEERRVTPTVPFSIASDPCVIRIAR